MMGYTHYWTRSLRDLDLPVWERFTHDVERILSIASLTADGDSLDPPIVSDLRVQFNGFSSDGCEPLVIGRLAADDASLGLLQDALSTVRRCGDGSVALVRPTFSRSQTRQRRPLRRLVARTDTTLCRDRNRARHRPQSRSRRLGRGIRRAAS